MRYMVTGHRLEKLENYDTQWIEFNIHEIINENQNEITLGYSGMASGVDLWFCGACRYYDVPYIACVPFEDQADFMDEESQKIRQQLLSDAKEIKNVRNRYMVEHCDKAVVVWDGNKGGTHNVLQQLIEKQIPFTWLNPVAEKIWECE